MSSLYALLASLLLATAAPALAQQDGHLGFYNRAYLVSANGQGEVEYPVVDLGSEMTDLVQAQTSYQANAEVLSHATDAYQAMLDIKA